MAEDISASVITLHQPRPKKAKTGAERARAYRLRKKASAGNPAPPSSEHLIPLDFPSADAGNPALPILALANAQLREIPQLRSAPSPAVTFRVTPSRPPVASIVLLVAALALAAVGVTINGWFARSLGSTEAAGWLFLAVGGAADLAALVTPSCAARLWYARQRGTSLAGWAVWSMTFAFAMTASVGFASVNSSDVTASR